MSASYPPPMDDSTLAERIREAIVKDERFSLDARNLKVLCKNGVIKLRGTVRNDQEKAEILTRTRRIAGPGAKIEDDIDVLEN
jgi:osmotically-inducible protein OsmY